MRGLLTGMTLLAAVVILGNTPARAQDRQRQRIHATEAQRQQLRECTEAAERLRDRAREMAGALEDPAFSPGEARPHRDRLRAEFQALERHHARLVAGLGAEQRDRVRERLRDMDRLQDRVRDCLRLIDARCDSPAPDRLRLREHAREVERDAERIRLQYHDLLLE